MSTLASIPSTIPSSLQQVHSAMLEAERDVRRCLREVGHRPLAQTDNACKEIGKRIAGIEANLKTLTCDEDTRESFALLSADLQCLTTRVAIAARQDQKKRKLEIQAILQTISKIEYSPCENEEPIDAIYVTSNETEQDVILPLLRSMKKISGGGHFGVSGLYNWDLIAQMKSEFAVLVDFNPHVPLFHRNMLNILIKAKSPEDFVALALDQMKKDIEDNRFNYARNMLYRPLDVRGQPYVSMSKIDQLAYEFEMMLQRENGALSKENFPFLQKMAQEGRILPLYLNFNDAKGIQAIADAVHKQGHVFSSIYLSNIFSWGHEDTFQSNVDALKQDGTCIIDSTVWSSFVRYGKDPITAKTYDADVCKREQAEIASKV